MKTLFTAAVLATAGLTAVPSIAADYTLRFSQHHSSESVQYKDVTLAIKDFVETESDGRIQVETFPNGTLHSAGDGFKALLTDITDIAPTYPIFSPNSFHLAHGLFLPGMFDSAYAIVQGAEELYREHLRPEYSKMGVELFMNATSAPYQLLTTVPVTSLHDLRGMKIRGAGGAVNEMVEALGATPVTTASSEMYSAFQQGIVDGVLVPTESFETYRLQEVAKYFVPLELGRAGNIPFGMNRSTFGELPDDLKDVVYRAGRYGSLLYADLTEQGVEDGMAALAEYGVKIVELSPEDQARLDEIKHGLVENYIKETEAAGYPAEEFVQAMRKLGDEFGEMTHEEMIARQVTVGRLDIYSTD